jgi:uncharacterized protein (DUF362 family)
MIVVWGIFMSVAVVDFTSYPTSISAAMDEIGAKERLHKEPRVLIKPNLVNTSPHPVTTSVDCCEAILKYIRTFSDAEIIIAEGTGDATKDTYEVFDQLGYTKLAARYHIQLCDLNTEPLTKHTSRNCTFLPEIYLPDIAFTHFVISVPVLKAHSLAIITGSLKNMMGFAPPKYYGGGMGGWKKSAFHGNMQQSIIELTSYKKPDLSIMDASIGLRDYHLGGRRCLPPVQKIIAGFDAVEVDRKAAGFLEIDWKTVPHLCGS